jgi:Holliday junction resolvase
MSGKASRTKGHSFERKIARKMQEVGFENARRHLEYHMDDAKGVDIDNTDPFKIQCKALKKTPNIPKVFDEIKDVDEDGIPVVAFKVDRKGEYICLKLQDFLNLVDYWHY